jgi:hypothetical protein
MWKYMTERIWHWRFQTVLLTVWASVIEPKNVVIEVNLRKSTPVLVSFPLVWVSMLRIRYDFPGLTTCAPLSSSIFGREVRILNLEVHERSKKGLAYEWWHEWFLWATQGATNKHDGCEWYRRSWREQWLGMAVSDHCEWRSDAMIRRWL